MAKLTLKQTDIAIACHARNPALAAGEAAIYPFLVLVARDFQMNLIVWMASAIAFLARRDISVLEELNCRRNVFANMAPLSLQINRLVTARFARKDCCVVVAERHFHAHANLGVPTLRQTVLAHASSAKPVTSALVWISKNSPAINQRKCECPYGFKSSLFHGSGGEAILTGNEVFGNCSDQSCVTGAEACRLQGDKHAMCYIPRESILGFYRCACSTRQYFYDGPDGTGSCEVVVSANPPPSFTKWLYIIAAVLGGVCLVVILINKCKFPNAESLVMVSVFFSFLDVASDILFVVAASPAFDSIIRHLFIPSIVFVILPLGLNIVAAYRVYTALQRDNKEFQKWQEKNEKGGGLFMFLCAINTELGLVMDSKLLGMQIFHAPIPSAVAYQLEWLGIVQNVFEDLPQLIIQGIALTALTSAGEGADNIALVSLALSTLSLLWGGLGRLVSLSKSLYGETSKQSRTRRGSHLSRYPTSQKAIDDVKTVVNGTDCEAVDAQSSTGPEAPTHLPSEPSKRGLRITEEMQEPVAAAGKVEDRNMPQLTLNQANGDADSDVSTKVLESGTTGNGSSITVGTLTQGNLNHHDSDTAAAVGPWREGGKNVLAVSRTQIASPSVVDGSVTNLNKSKISKREDEILQMVEIQLAAVARAKAQRK
eukprot:g34513.t1